MTGEEWRVKTAEFRKHPSTPHTPFFIRHTWRALRIPLFVLVGTGCYRYVPVSLQALRPSENVRVQVTDSAAVRLVRDFGAYLTELEGQITREVGDSVGVTVPVGRDYRGVALEGGRQTLFLGPSEVLTVRRREFSRRRTAAVSISALVVFGLIAAGVAQWGDPNTTIDEPPPPPPPGGAILLRFRFP